MQDGGGGEKKSSFARKKVFMLNVHEESTDVFNLNTRFARFQLPF